MAPNESKIPVTARVEKSTLEALERLAKASNTTVADVVRTAVENEVSRRSHAKKSPVVDLKTIQDQLLALTSAVTKVEAESRLNAALIRSIAVQVGANEGAST